MNKIQYIGFSKKAYEKFLCSNISNPKALDSFSINIIDLGDGVIWSCSKSTALFAQKIDLNNDLVSLRDIVRNSKKSKIIVLIPQNVRISHQDCRFSLCYDFAKNNLDFLASCFRTYMLLPDNIFFGFEPNETLIAGKNVQSDLYFKYSRDIITSAKESDKPTTIKADENLFFTTLNLQTEEDLIDFLKDIGLCEKENEYPQWLDDIDFNDDKYLKDANEKLLSDIDSINKEIDLNNNKLEQNRYFKSILVETGDNLVDIVFKIFKEILGIDLSSFEDKKKEDFLFKFDNVTYIGEIKGINEGIRNIYISQIDNHKSLYEDNLENNGLPNETIKKLLIINDQRKKVLIEREPVHINQIEKAEKEDVLIIRGIDLLKIYELFKQSKLTKDEIFNALKIQKGCINIESIKTL